MPPGWHPVIPETCQPGEDTSALNAKREEALVTFRPGARMSATRRRDEMAHFIGRIQSTLLDSIIRSRNTILWSISIPLSLILSNARSNYSDWRKIEPYLLERVGPDAIVECRKCFRFASVWIAHSNLLIEQKIARIKLATLILGTALFLALSSRCFHPRASPLLEFRRF